MKKLYVNEEEHSLNQHTPLENKVNLLCVKNIEKIFNYHVHLENW